MIIVRKDLKAQRTAAGAAGGWIACLPSVRSWEMTKRKSFIFFLQKFSGNGGTPFRLEKGKKSFLVLSPVLNRNICRKKSPFGDTLYVRRAISPHLLSHFRKRKSVVSETIKISFLTARIFSVPIPPQKKIIPTRGIPYVHTFSSPFFGTQEILFIDSRRLKTRPWL